MPEWEGCEKPVIERLVERGWEYVPGAELRLGNEELVIEDLREFVARDARERGIEIRDETFNQILLALRGKQGMEGYRETLNVIKDGFIAMDVRGKGIRTVRIIDYENTEKNKLVVSNQVTFFTADGREKRLDVVLFVNGIPLVAIECKNPIGPQDWYDAYRQLIGYEQALPELFRYIQLNVAIGSKARVYATMPWSSGERKRIKWGIGEFDELNAIADLLTPGILLDIIKNFVFILNYRGQTVKLMPRFMQYRASNKIYEAAIEGKRGGVVWHWQGSGKTFTMIFAAYKLYTDPRFQKPTVFFVMDRLELESQFLEFLEGFDFGGKITVEDVRSIEALERILKFDGGRGKRGFFVLLVHKFKEKGGIDLDELEKMQIVERENIFVFVDEAHRTQYGILAARMRRALKNAKFFAFTGTPLLKSDNRNTFREFGDILDRYFIEQSVKDGYTVPIVYTFAKEQGIHLNMEELKKAVEELTEKEEEEVKKRLRPTREFMKNESRMRKIAKSVVDDLLNNRRYKGMLVAVDRGACALYRKYIMEYVKRNYPHIYEKYGEGFAEIVMTYNPGKEKEKIVEDYRKDVEKRYGANWGDVNKKLREDFKDEQKNPRLIIVTDMLLTGYDVPVLEVMYLDKIMNGHNLLQAIARTNRPYKDKGFGVVVDYVGIFRIFKDTLRRYYAVSDEDVEHAALSVELLREMLVKNLYSFCEEFPYICENSESLDNGDRQSLYDALYRVYQDGKENKYEKRYREIRKIWNALGGDAIKARKRELQLFRAISAVYILHRRERREPVPGDVIKVIEDISEKIRTSSSVRMVRKRGEIIIGESFLREVERSSVNVEKIVDMTAILSMFVATVRGDAVKQSIYGDIVDYIESAIERWKERKSTFEEIYREEKKAIEKIIREQEKIAKLNISPAEYAIIKSVSEALKDKDVASVLHELLEGVKEDGLLFRGWNMKMDVVKKIRERVRKRILRYMVSKEKYDGALLDKIVDDIMKMLPYLEVYG